MTEGHVGTYSDGCSDIPDANLLKLLCVPTGPTDPTSCASKGGQGATCLPLLSLTEEEVFTFDFMSEQSEQLLIPVTNSIRHVGTSVGTVSGHVSEHVRSVTSVAYGEVQSRQLAPSPQSPQRQPLLNPDIARYLAGLPTP
jgi:hypothetical protein